MFGFGFPSKNPNSALVQAFKMTEDNGVRKDIVDAIDILLKISEPEKARRRRNV
jgi:hypothetical protein